MKATEKEQIKTKLAEYCETKGGQNKAANSMRSVSAATISQVLNNNWELISDEMWRTIASQVMTRGRGWSWRRAATNACTGCYEMRRTTLSYLL